MVNIHVFYWIVGIVQMASGCKCVGIDVNQINMEVCGSKCLGGVLWLLQSLVENHHSSRLIGEGIK